MQIAEFEHASDFFWNVTPEVQRIEMPLANLREMDAARPSESCARFLESVKDFPADAIVVITPGNLSMLVDDEGCLLEFA